MSDASNSNPQTSRALVRALIAGYVDAYALMTFGVYASFMTGNTTSGGVHFGHGHWAEAGHSLLPIPFFVLGILAGSLVVYANRQLALRRLSWLVAAMLAAAVAASYLSWPGWLGIVLLSSAMGLLNTSVTQVGGQTVSLGFMTGDLNNLAQHISQAILRAPVSDQEDAHDTHWRRSALLGMLWASFLFGAILGATLASRLAMWTLLLPAVLLVSLRLIEPDSLLDGNRSAISRS